jgi:hypothetical protein
MTQLTPELVEILKNTKAMPLATAIRQVFGVILPALDFILSKPTGHGHTLGMANGPEPRRV